tara:strand:+ start:35 stop:601 length:567 start_codon:yes stop_codon:yes gene_type:complete
MSTSINNLPNANNDDVEVIEDNNQQVKKLTGINQSHVPARSELPKQSINDVLQNLADNQPQQKLPSRDIPTNTVNIVNDEQIKPTYIPQESRVDYIRDHDNIDVINEKAKNTKNEDSINGYEQYLSYGVSGIVYILLQLPQVKRMFRNFVPGLFGVEGMPNMSYHVLLALILCIITFIMDKIVIRAYL